MKLFRRRNLLWLLVIAIALSVTAEFVISNRVVASLADIVKERLDASVEFDSAWYIPPYGMRLRGVRITRDRQQIVTLASLNVQLDRFPSRNQQIIIRSIDVDEPVIRIIPSESRQPPQAPDNHPPQATNNQPPRATNNQPPRKLSSLFRLTRLDIRGGQISYEKASQPMVFREINMNVDTTQLSDAKYTFALSAGDGANFTLDSKGSIDIDDVVLDLSEMKFSAHSEINHPPQSLPPKVQNALRASGMSGEVKLSLAGSLNQSQWAVRDVSGEANFKDAGRLTVSGAASAPRNHAGKPLSEAVSYDFWIQPHDFSVQVPGLSQRLEHVHGTGVHVFSGVVQFRDLAAAYGDDHLELRAARLDLKDLPESIGIREIDSTVAFGAAPSHYIPVVDGILDALQPSGPVVIGGEYIVARGDPRHPQYLLRISSDTASLNLLGGKLPITNIRGDARVVPGRVVTANASGTIFGGSAAVSGEYTFGDSTTCKGHFSLAELQVQELAKHNLKEHSEKLRGRGFLDADFDGDFTTRRSLDSLHAKGQAEIRDGDFFEIPVLSALLGAMKPKKNAATAGEFATLFEIKNGVIQMHKLAINAPILGLQGKAAIAFDGRIQGEVIAAPLADWRDKMNETKIPIISKIAGEIVGGVQKLLNAATGTLLYNFSIGGTFEKPKVTPIPVPVLTNTAALLFGKMLGQKEDEHLVDYIKDEK